nr:glycoside hydrolase family 55 protein [Paenibacillus oenotherae]
MYNVLECGLVGDGVTDDTAELQALVNMAIAAGSKAIYFPHTSSGGQYYITSVANADQVVFFGDNASFVGGYTGVIYQMGDWVTNSQLAQEIKATSVIAGGLGSGNGGVLIGGTVPGQPDGIFYGTDGNPSWATIQTSRRGANTEITVQPNSYNGFVNTNGTAVTWVSGSLFDENWLGANIYIDNALYNVLSVDSTTTLTLTGSAGVQNDVLYQKVATTSKGIVDTNGVTVSWVSGELFAYWWTEILINGISYSVLAVSEDALTITLGSSAGVQNSVPYIHDSTESYDCAAIGLNKMSGGSEERIVIVAKAFGEYRIGTVATNRGQHYPIYIDTGGRPTVKMGIDQTVELFPDVGGESRFRMILGGSSPVNSYYLIAKSTGEFVLYGENGVNEIFTYDPTNQRLNFNRPPVLPSFAKESLPSVTPAGSQIFVTDDVGGPTPAYSDGMNWRRVADRAIIS